MAERDPNHFIDTFGALSRCLRGLIAAGYGGFDVGSTQAKLVRHIGKHSRISQADLARATETDPTLTGRALETLVSRGWVSRSRSEEDRRQYVLELAPLGQRLRKRLEEARLGVAQRIVAELDDRDLEDFERIAGKLLKAFGAP